MSFVRAALILSVLLVSLAPFAAGQKEGDKKEIQKKSDKGKKKADLPPAGPFVPKATPIDHIKIKKDFKVELLYTVPKEQGSWVNLTVDPKGRLITSDQYGKLFRVTPPALGKSDPPKIEPINVDIGEAQGLLWAFDSLYVVVNRGGKYQNGLYRVRDTNGDGDLDTVEKLKDMPGNGGEHGPHAVLLGPDKKSLVVMAGNHTPLIPVDAYVAPKLWGEDFILPRQWDASGHARGILAPGGWICKTDPDGKRWELISHGYRNQYDGAFNREGELFTYDSDMEWDMNTPWYRPTRVCHATPGSEFGWRSGTGVYPDYYPDTLPPVVNIGPGSPTGVVFGYGAKFPAKYQDALFLCDWSYGKLYAVHMKPKGSSYSGEAEEFLSGIPMPLTDIIVHPEQGCIYFTIGGRRTVSGLYRITYTGSESTAPSKGNPQEGAEARKKRHALEAHYLSKDGKAAVEAAWPYLKDQDPFLRWTARTILEQQDPALWTEKVFSEVQPRAALAGLLAVVRKVDPSLQQNVSLLPRVIDALERVDNWTRLDEPLRQEWLRVLSLAFIRLGQPNLEDKDRLLRRLEPMFPAKSRELNAELCKVLVYLQSPTVAAKAVDLMTKAPTQEEQMEYALSLRNLKDGWTPKLRETYFTWFLKAANYRGGNSFAGFVRNIKDEAVALLDAKTKESLKPILEASPKVENPWANAKARPFVKNWTIEELLPLAEKKLTGRDFDRGRQIFGENKCYACHRFNNEGGAFGPDLTILSGRFGVRDLLDKVINPNRYISDQYAGVTVITGDGKTIAGRIINLSGDMMMINTDMLNPNALAKVNRTNVESITPAKVSMMPTGLLDTLQSDEILDLVAYLLSRGDRQNAMFKK